MQLMKCWLAAAALAAASLTHAADPERIVVPYAVGGITDLYGRVLAEKLQAGQSHPILVDNRPGGGGGHRHRLRSERRRRRKDAAAGQRWYRHQPGHDPSAAL
ncbi:hypothetical protein [Bordetella holmesii]|uniref:hypothetical protein n=1 Tax=Bordetella holmesii TaxID=35814 RepID=UPI001F269296|nr:hypothetical protein [Bordetella holmesii]